MREEKHNPQKVSRNTIWYDTFLLFSYPQTALEPFPSVSVNTSPASQDLSCVLCFRTPWNCNPKIDKDGKSTSFLTGKKAREVGLQDVPCQREAPFNAQGWKQATLGSAWTRTFWNVFITYTKGFLCSVWLYLKIKDKIISLPTRSSQISFLGLKH